MTGVRLGVLYRCGYPPERLPGFARRVEQLGFDELWVAEDCFFGGGIAAAAVAAGATTSLTVGIGILPVVLRNPALAAMELSTLCRMFPGRILPGFGHGVPAWMKQVGAYPMAPLTALAETVACVRDLLHGRTVTVAGEHCRLDQVTLDHAPTAAPPVVIGCRRPRSLRVSGAVADGSVIAELTSPTHLQWMKQRIGEGRQAAGRSDSHRVTVYSLLDLSGVPGHPQLRREVAIGLRRAEVIRTDDPELNAAAAALAAGTGGVDDLAAALPQQYVEQLGTAGPTAARAVADLAGAGADTVVFIAHDDPDTALAELASAVTLRPSN